MLVISSPNACWILLFFPDQHSYAFGKLWCTTATFGNLTDTWKSDGNPPHSLHHTPSTRDLDSLWTTRKSHIHKNFSYTCPPEKISHLHLFARGHLRCFICFHGKNLVPLLSEHACVLSICFQPLSDLTPSGDLITRILELTRVWLTYIKLHFLKTTVRIHSTNHPPRVKINSRHFVQYFQNAIFVFFL